MNAIYISYHRERSTVVARAAFAYLKEAGYNVFMDNLTTGDGTFRRVTLRQIPARPHFIAFLSRGALDERQAVELETAIETARNIVPVYLGGYSAAEASDSLPPELADIAAGDTLEANHASFPDAMAIMIDAFLSRSVSVPLEPMPDPHGTSLLQLATAPYRTELEAEGHLLEGLARLHAHDEPGAMAQFTRAVEVDNGYAWGYYHRGLLHRQRGEPDLALADYNRAIQADPTHEKALINRGNILSQHQFTAAAVSDYTAALHLRPTYSRAYFNRAATHIARGTLVDAATDYEHFLSTGGGTESENAHARAMIASLRGMVETREVAPVVVDVTVKIGARTDVGRVRDHNEDSLWIWSGRGAALGIIADGMGGAAAGEQASQIAIDAIRGALDVERPGADAYELGEGKLRMSVEAANTAILDTVTDYPEYKGMGTTVTMALVKGFDVILAHVGDSRGYRVDIHNEVQQLTEDHSFIKAMLDAGHITEDQMDDHPMGHVLYRALGQFQDLDVDVYHFRLNNNDAIVLCSDGLTNHVSEYEISAAVAATRDDPQATADRLVAAAIDSGGEDNISVIVATVIGTIMQEQQQKPELVPTHVDEDIPPLD